jgi:hypothetical protein
MICIKHCSLIDLPRKKDLGLARHCKIKQGRNVLVIYNDNKEKQRVKVTWSSMIEFWSCQLDVLVTRRDHKK